MIVLAHGIGEVRGLPLSGELVLQTGGIVVLASFLAVALLWREPRFAAVAPGRPSAPGPDPAPGSAPAPAPAPREAPTSAARLGTFDSASARFGQAAMLLLATAVSSSASSARRGTR